MDKNDIDNQLDATVNAY